MPDTQIPKANSQADKTTGACLALDYGTRRIGVAIGELTIGTARPLSVIANRQGTPDWQALETILQQWQPICLVVGWPLTENGEMQPITVRVGQFINQLSRRYDLPVHKVDERYTSNAAQQSLRELRASGQRRRRVRHEDIDSVSAALILQSWMTEHA